MKRYFVFNHQLVREIAASVNFECSTSIRTSIRMPEKMLEELPAQTDATINYSDGTVRQLSNVELRQLVDLFNQGGSFEGTVKIKLASRMIAGMDAWQEIFLGSQIGCNLFLSTRSPQGVKPHFDDHHVFAIQLRGEKVWNLGGVVASASIERTSRYPQDEPKINHGIQTMPGDILYMPPGEWHGTYTPHRSAHMTIGIYPPTYAEVLRAAIRERAQIDPLVRAYLPIKLHSDGLVKARAVSPAQLSILAARLPRLPLTVQKSMNETLSLAVPIEQSLPEIHLPEVLSMLDTELVLSVYGRGSAARGEKWPWDVDFLIITQDTEEANRLAESLAERSSRDLPIDLKILSTTHLASTLDGIAKRNQYSREAVLLWGEDVLSMMSTGTIDADVLMELRKRTLRVAQANLDKLKLGVHVEQRRVAKSIIRLGSIRATQEVGHVVRTPVTCAAYLVFEFPHLSEPVGVLLASLGGAATDRAVVDAGETILNVVGSELG